MKNFIFTFINSFLFTSTSVYAGEDMLSNILAKFNHQMHEEKVLPTFNVSCSICHSFELDLSLNTAKATSNSTTSAFRTSVKEVCHQCHNTESPKYRNVPKSCSLCHADQAAMQKIRPKNHDNIAWKNTHALNAEVTSDTCLNCHITSQCIKCHVRRNDVELKNHSRNFRFTHSVIARAQPQKCDTCHVQTFCVRCHIGK